MAKRANGEGTSYFDEKRKIWIHEISYLNYDTGKKSRKKFAGKTQKEAIAKGKEFKKSINNGLIPTAGKIKVGEWIDCWLNDYLKEKKPSDVIVPQKDSKPEMEEKIIKREKNIFQIVLLWMTFTAIMIGAIFWVYEKFALRLDAVEQKAQEKNFIPEEITQGPNEEGGYDVYGTGKMKLSE